jgi:hypothetical protein
VRAKASEEKTSQHDEARRREKLYQTAIKSQNMLKWLGQLTEYEPEETEL